MSTFSTKGGLYERAQKRFGVTDGKKLFTFSFFEKQRLEAMVRCPCTFATHAPCTSNESLLFEVLNCTCTITFMQCTMQVVHEALLICIHNESDLAYLRSWVLNVVS